MALFVDPDSSNDCCCPPMTGLVESCPPNPLPTPLPITKYFHEVGAEMIGNQLIIRMEKDKNKKNKKKDVWEPPCDCNVIEIKRPTSTKGPRIVNGGDNNQILFRIHSKTHLNKKEDANYKPQTIAYKINRSGTEYDNHCRKVTVYPQLGGPISQEVYSDHITEGCQDVYLLRVKKKNDSAEDGNKRNMEIELRTPKPPPEPVEVPKRKVCEKPPEEQERDDQEKIKSDTKKNGKNKKNGKSEKKK